MQRIRGVFWGTLCLGIAAFGLASAPAQAAPACPAIDTIDQQGTALYSLLGMVGGWAAGDYDQNGVVDNFESGLVATILCNQRNGRWAEVNIAFNTQLTTLSTEPTYGVIQQYKDAIVSLMLVSSAMRDKVKTGLNLQGDYQPFRYDNVEVFAKAGDFDFDGQNNGQEYQAALNQGGGRALFVSLATRPTGFNPQFVDGMTYLYTEEIDIFGLVNFALLGEDPLTTDLDMNGMIDYAQAALFDEYCRWADNPGWFIVREAYINNEYAVKEVTNQIPTIFWAVLDRGRVERALNGLVTSSGTLGVAAIIAFTEILEEEIVTYDIVVDPSSFDVRGEQYVGVRGHADADAYCNLSEYLVQPAILPGFQAFARNATNPDVTLSAQACGEPEQNNGAMPNFCPVNSTLDVDGQTLYSSRGLDWDTADVDGNGMRDRWELALTLDVLCDTASPHYFVARQKYTGNFERLQGDDNTAAVGSHIFVLAGLMSTSSGMASYWKGQFELSGYYNGYKDNLEDEPLSAFGDLDGDGIVNTSEYQTSLNRNETKEEYVLRAKTPSGLVIDRCEGACDGPGGGSCAVIDFPQHMRDVDAQIEPFRDDLGGYVFHPASADINGGVDLDNDTILPNGILDLHEFELINHFFKHPNLDFSATGGPTSAEVCQAYTRNLNRMLIDIGGQNGLVNTLAPGLKFLAAAYMTLGDENSVGSIVLALTEASQVDDLPLGVQVPNLANYTLLPQWFAFDADIDGDGYTNLEEYQCLRPRSQCCYILGVLDPEQTPDVPGVCGPEDGEEGEGEGAEGEGEGEGSAEGEGEGGEGEGEGEDEDVCEILPCELECESEGVASGFEAQYVKILDLLATLDDDFDVPLEEADLDENGLLDLAHARFLDTVLGDPSTPQHCCVKASWDFNYQMTADLIIEFQAHPLWVGIPALLGVTEAEAIEILQIGITGLMTIGEDGTKALIADALNGIDLPVPLPTINVNAFDDSSKLYLGIQGDIDLDGVCNLGEYSGVIEQENGIELFIAAAIDPLQNFDAGTCPPCDTALCRVQMSSASMVPVNESTAVGEAVFRELESGLIRLRITHDVANPTAAVIRAGAPGVNGNIVFNLGDPTSPIVVDFTVAQFEQFLGDRHIVVFSSAYLSGEIRGDILCAIGEGEGEGEGAEGEGEGAEGEGEGTEGEGEGEGAEGEGEGGEGEGEGGEGEGESPNEDDSEFCVKMNEIVATVESDTFAPVVELLGDDAALISMLRCAVADLNGPFVDTDVPPDGEGDEPGPNGMLDGAFELGVIARLRALPEFYEGLATGTLEGQVQAGVDPVEVQAAYTANYNAMLTPLNNLLPVLPALVQALTGITLTPEQNAEIQALFPKLLSVLAAYTVLGDEQSVETVLFLMDLLRDFAPALPNGPEDFVKLDAFLSFSGDADGDGFSNRAEYNAFVHLGPAAYVDAALNPLIVPELTEGEGGEGEGEFDPGVLVCTVGLSGSAMVPPSASSATGEARFYELSNGNVRVEVTHDVANATATLIRAGQPGQNTLPIVLNLGAALSPVASVITGAQFEQVSTGHYLTIHSSDFLAGAIRGNIDCTAVGEGEGEEGEGGTEGEGEGVVEGEGEEGEGSVEGEGGEGEGEGEGEGTVEGEGEGEGVPLVHSTDTDGDGAISLNELLRMIQLFNSSGYHCDASNPEDGFATGPGDTSCAPHAADYEQDWSIDLSELLRIIQFYNSGGYHRCTQGEASDDGYCTGPGA